MIRSCRLTFNRIFATIAIGVVIVTSAFGTNAEDLKGDPVLPANGFKKPNKSSYLPEKDGHSCILMSKIDVVGATLITTDEINVVLAPWIGKCIGQSKFDDILQGINQLYIASGFVTSRAYLGKQDLAGGALTITIVEGKLEDIVLEKANGNFQSNLLTAFPGLIGKPLNLRDAEQGLDQLNRSGTKNAKMQIKPGKEAGGSTLGISLEPTKSWQASFGIDNLGTSSAGLYQTRADFSVADLTGFNDEWRIGYQRSMDASNFKFDGDRPNNDAFNIGWSIPYGYWTGGIDGYKSDYRSKIIGQVSEIETSGGSMSVSPYLTRLISRDQTSKTSVTARLTWKETENFILGNKVDVSSRTLSIASLELDDTRVVNDGQFSTHLGLNQGINAFGSIDDSRSPDGLPKAQFQKMNASLSYVRPISVFQMNPVFNFSFGGQLSADRLFGSEQLALGGNSTIRGIREAVLYANKAIYSRNVISLPLQPSANADEAKLFGQIEPYFGIDAGQTFEDDKNNNQAGTLIGVVLGIKNRSGYFGFDVSYSRILAHTLVPSVDIDEGGIIQFRQSISF